MPESFNVLLRELQGLNLNIELLEKDEMETANRVMSKRYEELEKLEGQYDIEMDIPPLADANEKLDDSVVSPIVADEEV